MYQNHSEKRLHLLKFILLARCYRRNRFRPHLLGIFEEGKPSLSSPVTLLTYKSTLVIPSELRQQNHSQKRLWMLKVKSCTMQPYKSFFKTQFESIIEIRLKLHHTKAYYLSSINDKLETFCQTLILDGMRLKLTSCKKTSELTEPVFCGLSDTSKSILVVIPSAVEIFVAVCASLNHLKCHSTEYV